MNVTADPAEIILLHVENVEERISTATAGSRTYTKSGRRYIPRDFFPSGPWSRHYHPLVLSRSGVSKIDLEGVIFILFLYIYFGGGRRCRNRPVTVMAELCTKVSDN